MEIAHVLLLALIQGITEFLPISSSAHLILPMQILGWPDQGLAFDTAVHLGTLTAVVFYFRVDLYDLTRSLWAHVTDHRQTENSWFAIYLLIASTPIIPVGFILRFVIEGELRDTLVIALATIGFGVALFVADYTGKKDLDDGALGFRSALLIGIAQCLALIPGTSRSGVTITAALLAGHSRTSAARISFLISIPAISGAASIKAWDLLAAPTAIDWPALIIGFTVAAATAYLCIRLFLDFISDIGYLPFVIYRLTLGSLLLFFFL